MTLNEGGNIVFCINCGNEITGKFCAECGTPAEVKPNPPLDENTQIGIQSIELNGHQINMDDIFSTYGKYKIAAIQYLKAISGATLAESKNAYEESLRKSKPPEEKSLGFWEQAKLQTHQIQVDKFREKAEQKERISQMDRDGVAYCPKCYSTSLSAHKKGFGIGKAVVGGIAGVATGGALGLVGLTAGNLGAKKILVTCMKCGHQFWAGKK